MTLLSPPRDRRSLPGARAPRRAGRPRWLLAGALGSLVAACGLEQRQASLAYSLNPKTLAALEAGFDYEDEREAAAAQVRGALEMFFGTPHAPAYYVLDDWYDEELDPNRGARQLDEEATRAWMKDNARRFKFQLQMLERGEYADVPEPHYAARDVWAAWLKDFAPLHTGEPSGGGEGDSDSELVRVSPGSPHPGDYGDSYTAYWRETMGIDDETPPTWHDEAVAFFMTRYPTLRESAEMYRLQCLHCHGVEGGGDGPTAEYLEPRPRDYREGKFKWVAVDRNQRPRHEDLMRILRDGVTFTAMPSFARFSLAELHGVADYVQLLSIRGETELLLADEAANERRLAQETPIELYELVWDRWKKSEDNAVAMDVAVPRNWDLDDPANHVRIERGRELFLTEAAACATCHGEDGRGDGTAVWLDAKLDPTLVYEDTRPKLDEKGQPVLDENGEQVVQYRDLDEWGNPSRPRNFTVGIFRGGNRPIDFYRRIKYGIGGTKMPAASTELSDDDIFDLVYYVRSVAAKHDLARIAEARKARKADGSHAATDEHGAGGQ